MGNSFITGKEKIQMLKNEDGTSNHIGNIGDLPEAILVHILSFLPMRDAVRTSALSKEWHFLWTSIPNLIFDEHDWQRSNTSRKRFKDFIDRVLLLHGSSSIKKFSLTYAILHDEDRLRFDGWVSNVLWCNVREINLRLRKGHDYRGIFRLPHDLFRCDTLVQLNLGFVDISTLHLPSQIHLPNLKALYLENARFLDERSIQQLFSSPALQILEMNYCSLEKISVVSISAPKLKHLILIEHALDDHCCQIMIYNCSLMTLNLSGYIVNDMLAFNAVNTLQLGYFEMTSALFGNILQSTPHLHTLRLYKGIYYPYHGEDEEIFDQVPSCFFSSLKKIVIEHLFLQEGELYVFKTMLKYAMVLEEFVISDEASYSMNITMWDRFSLQLRACPRGSNNCKITIPLVYIN